MDPFELVSSAILMWNFLISMLHRCDSAVLSGCTLMLFTCIVWLKLVSYAHTNYDLRVLAKSLDKVMQLRRDIIDISWCICHKYFLKHINTSFRIKETHGLYAILQAWFPGIGFGKNHIVFSILSTFGLSLIKKTCVPLNTVLGCY